MGRGAHIAGENGGCLSFAELVFFQQQSVLKSIGCHLFSAAGEYQKATVKQRQILAAAGLRFTVFSQSYDWPMT